MHPMRIRKHVTAPSTPTNPHHGFLSSFLSPHRSACCVLSDSRQEWNRTLYRHAFAISLTRFDSAQVHTALQSTSSFISMKALPKFARCDIACRYRWLCYPQVFLKSRKLVFRYGTSCNDLRPTCHRVGVR